MSYVSLLNTMISLRRVERLLNKKQAIEAELAKIRSECRHTDQHVTMVPRGPGCQMEIRWVCVNCAETLRYPTEQEINRYVRKDK